ncbi:MAG TPA: response regulator transcription factor [Ramlibacter sp.]|nr:response regulator transcription factor [Ramlibacter sp.]
MLEPMPQAAPGASSEGAVVKLLVKGFGAMEHRLLQGAVKLSQRRAPRIDLLADSEAASADVVLVDATEAAALQWSALQPWLAGKAVIWAGAKAARPGHMVTERHVMWPILPVLLYRALEQHGNARAATRAHAGAGRVLVVDDSLAVRHHLRSLLERRGIEVTDVATAEAGIEACAAASDIACVLMDVLMPGIDGFEACRRIKARGRAAPPVVMLTSKSSPFDRVRGKMAGCDTYLTKPVDPEQLHDVLGRLVSHNATPSSPPSERTPA